MHADRNAADSAAAADIFARAQTSCVGCATYHGIWPYLRLAGITRTQVDLEEIMAQIRAGVTRGARHVLIAGAADALTTMKILGALPSDGAAHVEVIDRCATPLETIRRALAPREHRVTLRQADLLDDVATPMVDIALAHGLLGFFSDDDQVKLLRAIGRRFTANSALIVTETVGIEMERDADSIRLYAESLIVRLAGAGISLPVSEPEFLAALLQDCQRRLRTRGRFADEASVVALLERSGFAVGNIVTVDRDPPGATDPMKRRAGRRAIFTASLAAGTTA